MGYLRLTVIFNCYFSMGNGGGNEAGPTTDVMTGGGLTTWIEFCGLLSSYAPSTTE